MQGPAHCTSRDTLPFCVGLGCYALLSPHCSGLAFEFLSILLGGVDARRWCLQLQRLGGLPFRRAIEALMTTLFGEERYSYPGKNAQICSFRLCPS
jgi:hypothetical protein